MVGLAAMPEQHPDGLSITSLVQGGKSIEREGIYWHFPHYSNHGMQSPGGAIRVGDWKLLEYYENGTVQLFNLKNDLGERKELALRHPEKAAELRQQLHAWRERVGANMMPPNPDYQAH